MSKLVDGNGKEHSEPNPHEPFQIMLTMDRSNLHVEIAGNVQDLDVALNMLASATRFFDTQYRIAAGLQAQQAVNKAQKDFDFAYQLLRKQ